MTQHHSFPELSRYTITRHINAGGMGTVYVGTHKELGKEVAIKIPLASIVRREDAMIRFKREGKILAALNHPNIVAVHDAGIDNGYPFLVMEYIEGENFDSRVKRLGGEDIDNVIKLCSQISDALEYMHTRDVIHRDIKSANIILDASGTPILTDFGIAYSSDFTVENLTTDGFMGTLRYVAPELLSGGFPSALSDIYSFGVVLYECLAGASPFDGMSAAVIMKQILEEEPVPIQHERPEVPDWLAALVNKCLAKKIEDRFQSAGEILRALGNADPRLQRTEPIRAPEKTKFYNEPLVEGKTIADDGGPPEHKTEIDSGNRTEIDTEPAMPLSGTIADGGGGSGTGTRPVEVLQGDATEFDYSFAAKPSKPKPQKRRKIPTKTVLMASIGILSLAGGAWFLSNVDRLNLPEPAEGDSLPPDSAPDGGEASSSLSPALELLLGSADAGQVQERLVILRDENGLLTFGRKEDFVNPEKCHVLILSDNKVESLLVPSTNGWVVHGTGAVVQNPLASYRGKVAIWIELQD